MDLSLPISTIILDYLGDDLKSAELILHYLSEHKMQCIDTCEPKDRAFMENAFRFAEHFLSVYIFAKKHPDRLAELHQAMQADLRVQLKRIAHAPSS